MELSTIIIAGVAAIVAPVVLLTLGVFWLMARNATPSPAPRNADSEQQPTAPQNGSFPWKTVGIFLGSVIGLALLALVGLKVLPEMASGDTAHAGSINFPLLISGAVLVVCAIVFSGFLRAVALAVLLIPLLSYLAISIVYPLLKDEIYQEKYGTDAWKTVERVEQEQNVKEALREKKPKEVQVVPSTQLKEVIAYNFVIPANSVVEVPRQGRACKANSKLGPAITAELTPTNVVFRSKQSTDLYARVWLYDRGNSHNCKARYDILASQGKIF